MDGIDLICIIGFVVGLSYQVLLTGPQERMKTTDWLMALLWVGGLAVGIGRNIHIS